MHEPFNFPLKVDSADVTSVFVLPKLVVTLPFNPFIFVTVSCNLFLILSIPPHLGVLPFVYPSRISPKNLSSEHSVSAKPTKIEFDWDKP